MKAAFGFMFFMLFLAGIAFVNLKGRSERVAPVVTSNADLANSAWRPTHIGEMVVQEDSVMKLEFDDGDGIAGHAGCNRFFGQYQVADGAFEVSPLGTTRMACPEPAHSLETAFLQSLQATRSVARNQSGMVMRDDEGAVVMRFVAASRADSKSP